MPRSGAAALSLATLLVTRVIPAANVLGFVVIAYLLFLAVYGVLVSLEHDGRTVRDRPAGPLTVGGILHAMVGTLIQLTIALIITVPLGLACAVYLNEARICGPGLCAPWSRR
ncbi:MAG: hypothetical protein ACRDS1_07335 [Pseudonocardiaceae bacterium]